MKSWRRAILIGLGIVIAIVGNQWLWRSPKPTKGGQKPAAKSVRHRLHHWETTGLTDYLVVNGKEIAIQFSSDSNRTAVKTANGWTVADEENPKWPDVWITGTLLPAIHMTPNCEGCAGPEPYQEFRLEYAEVYP